jgi:anaerobic selenocysteine-containing dehydrogenase
MTAAAEPAARTSYITCPLCEATCGLEVTTRGDEVLSIRGDREDVFSQGYICPKAAALKALHTDPDRLRAPLVREGTVWRRVSWDEAFATVERLLLPVIQQYGKDAVATYVGNPSVHNLSGQLYPAAVIRALGTHNTYSASTLDQQPKQLAAGLMFGAALSVPIPDVDRTDYLLVLGANPLVSNGSLMTAPDMRGRIRRLRARGGRVVVVDPRRTRTADEADEHVFIQPGSDPYLLFGIVHTLFAEDLVRLGAVAEHLNGLEEVRALAQDFAPEVVAPLCRVPAETIRRLAREVAAAPTAAVYGRIGTCTQRYGTLANWLVDVVNTLTGNLDRPGGALFTKAAAGARNTAGRPGTGSGMRMDGKPSRVRGGPHVNGELPAACLAEEMDTPGAGQVRALITIAGNPALSAPNGDRLQAALAHLDALICVDAYLNETTRHAHVILPPPSPLERPHYDLGLYQFAVRNIAHYSLPVFHRDPGQPEEWEVLLRMAGIAAGQGAKAPVAALDEFFVLQLLQRDVRLPGSSVEGRDPQELLAALAPRRGPERVLDHLLRVGPYGDGYGARPDGLTLDRLAEQPHGMDLGPLQPRIPEVLRTPSGKVELAPAPLVADVARLRAGLGERPAPLVLIGRRELRSNNSWMHNLEPLVKGDDQCTLLVHPDDATRFGLADGGMAEVASAAARARVPVRVTDTMMPGVVSLPHGWGHAQPGTAMRVAAAHAGVNINRLIPDAEIDPLSGNAVLTAVPVELAPVAMAEPVGALGA